MNDPTPVDKAAKTPATLLLVEDDAIIGLAEAKALRAAGYEVIHVLSGEAAIERVAALGEDIDLILMDVDLGKGIDGPEAAMAILESWDVPVVFLSSHTEPEIVEKTERITNYGYILKSAGQTVIQASIRMTFKLHDAYVSLMRKEEALQRSEEKYSKAFMASPVPIMITRTRDGTLIEVNETFTRAFGYSRQDVIGRGVPDLGIWWLEEERKAVMRRMAVERRIMNLEIGFRRKDGSRLDGVASFDFIILDGEECIIALAEDVTERKAMDLALKDKEAHYRVLFHELSNAVIEEDFSAVKRHIDGLRASGITDMDAYLSSHLEEVRDCVSMIRIIRFNEEYLRILNAPSRAAVSKTLMPYVPDEALIVLKDEIVGLLAAKGPVEISCPNFVPDTGADFLKLRLSLVSGHEDDWSSVLVTFTDVTREIRSEAALQDLLRQKDVLMAELEDRVTSKISALISNSEAE